jgi:hypothetical protein
MFADHFIVRFEVLANFRNEFRPARIPSGYQTIPDESAEFRTQNIGTGKTEPEFGWSEPQVIR